jgi:hypothetical protein
VIKICLRDEALRNFEGCGDYVDQYIFNSRIPNDRVLEERVSNLEEIRKCLINNLNSPRFRQYLIKTTNDAFDEDAMTA